MPTRLPLVPSDDPILRKVAARVSDPKQVEDLAADLFVTMQAEGGVGLAAPQVGKSVRLFVTSAGGGPAAFINPEIVERSKEKIDWEEGCLSLPRMLVDVRRPKRVTLRAQTLDGQTATIEADDLLARVIQHEIDHLDGILFPDRMDDLSKLRKISQEEWDSRFNAAELRDAEM